MPPKISIITPVYDNGKEYMGLKWLSILNQCLENQTEQDFEWIIIYDGISSECRRQVINYRNVNYFETGRRMGNWGNWGRDYGLNFVIGKYVVFIDQDSIIYENYLSVLSTSLDEHNKFDFVCAPIYISWNCEKDILIPSIEHGRMNSLCFMTRIDLLQVSGWWSRNDGNGDENLILKNWIDSGSNGLCLSTNEPVGIWSGSRFQYPKDIYPSFIDYSEIEKIAGIKDEDTKKDGNLWFSH